MRAYVKIPNEWIENHCLLGAIYVYIIYNAVSKRTSE
jgi:hypothetical protein